MCAPSCVAYFIVAGFSDVGFEDVLEPVFYGANVETALDIVCSIRMVNDLRTALGASAKERARTWLRTLLAAHAGCDGIDFD